MRPHVRERALTQVRRRCGPDEVADQRDRIREPSQLLGAGIAAGNVTDDRGGHRRVAGHQPLEPAGLDGRKLQLFENVLVVHRSPRDGQWSGPASSAGAR